MKMVQKKGKQDEYQKLNQEIGELLGSFVPLGQKLIQMRDSGLYRKGGYPTFDDYVRQTWSIAARTARDVIQDSMIGMAIGGGNSAVAITIQNHARLLAECKVAEFLYENREEGGKVPVAVANPDDVQKVWKTVATKYTEAKKKDPDKKFSANFIASALPPKYKRNLPDRFLRVPGKKLGKVGQIALSAGKVSDRIHDIDLDNLKELSVSEEWTSEKLNSMRRDLKSAADSIDKLRSALRGIRC